MKRAGNLLSLIVEPDNLRLAFYKAARGKEGQAEVEDYRATLDQRLEVLRGELISGNVSVGDYHYFRIYDPKERVICAASFPERVLHHALMNICHPVFEQFQIYHSYATRPGKGTFAALEYARCMNARCSWFLKLDIRKYFDSISHTQLLRLLQRKIKDRRVLNVFTRIITSYSVRSERGLPIGNLTSQYFANYYLAFLDHYIQEKLRHGAYVRYMDDMVLWSNDRKELSQKGKLIEGYLREQLLLVLGTSQLNRSRNGLPFLGFRLRSRDVRLSSRSKRRFCRKATLYQKWLDEGRWDDIDYNRHILPLLAFVRKGNTQAWRNSLFLTINGYDQGL